MVNLGSNMLGLSPKWPSWDPKWPSRSSKWPYMGSEMAELRSKMAGLGSKMAITRIENCRSYVTSFCDSCNWRPCKQYDFINNQYLYWQGINLPVSEYGFL